MERDDEARGKGNSYAFGDYGYDPRLARRFNNDPITYPWQSTYAAFNNNPIYYSDPLGLEGEPKNDKVSRRELKRAVKYSAEHPTEEGQTARVYSYEKDGRVRYGVRIDQVDVSTDSDGGVVITGSTVENITFNRVATWWKSWDTGTIIWGSSKGGQETYGKSAFDFEFLETITLDEINDLLRAGKGWMKKGGPGTGKKASGRLDKDPEKTWKAIKMAWEEELKNPSNAPKLEVSNEAKTQKSQDTTFTIYFLQNSSAMPHSWGTISTKDTSTSKEVEKTISKMRYIKYK